MFRKTNNFFVKDADMTLLIFFDGAYDMGNEMLQLKINMKIIENR
jgi:hypothetical protein